VKRLQGNIKLLLEGLAKYQEGAMKFWKQLLNNESGHVLALALVLLVVGSLLAVSVVRLVFTTTTANAEATQRLQEFYAADAGIEYGYWELDHNGDGNFPYNLTVNGAPVEITIHDTTILGRVGEVVWNPDAGWYPGENPEWDENNDALWPYEDKKYEHRGWCRQDIEFEYMVDDQYSVTVILGNQDWPLEYGIFDDSNLIALTVNLPPGFNYVSGSVRQDEDPSPLPLIFSLDPDPVQNDPSKITGTTNGGLKLNWSFEEGAQPELVYWDRIVLGSPGMLGGWRCKCGLLLPLFHECYGFSCSPRWSSPVNDHVRDNTKLNSAKALTFTVTHPQGASLSPKPEDEDYDKVYSVFVFATAQWSLPAYRIEARVGDTIGTDDINARICVQKSWWFTPGGTVFDYLRYPYAAP